MKKTRTHLARAAMMLLLAVLCVCAYGAAGGGTSNKIVVVSDIHVMAPSLLPSGAETQEAWTTYYAGQHKMLQQSAAIFDQFIQNMIALRPKAVLITGDLTKDGEKASHEYVRNGLETLEYEGINVYVIPGNHDFGASGSPTQFNADGTTEDAPVLAYNEFQSFYYNHGYDSWESTFDPNSLSYTTELMEGLVLLAIDSHKASVSAETLEWLIEKAKTARNSGKQVIAMMHHPLFPHITGGDMYIDTYTVSDYATVRDALIDAGVNVILSGHFHTSDIAKDWKDDASKSVYDVNTGSLISYPCDYRILTPSSDLMSLSVTTSKIVPTGMTASECKEWLQGRMKTAATQKMNDKAGAAAGLFATQINNLSEFLANLFVIHAEGDEVGSADRGGLVETYTNFTNDNTYSTVMAYGGITDASIYSVLDDVSNYGTDKADVTKDRTLTINLPEVGPFKPTEPGTITIGSGENYTDLPLTAQYKYALTQQVFSANEINHAKGKIWSIAFRTKKGDLTRKYNVYVTHTDQSSMSSYSWQPVTAADCYFSGEVMFTSGQWNTIYFDKPFEYDGKSNIVVTVDDNTGRSDGWGALTNAYFYGDGNHAIARDNSKDIDPLDATSIENASQKNSYDYKNQIQFVFGDYPTPSNFAVTEIGNETAVAQCTLRGEATAWNLRYRKVGDETWTVKTDIDATSFSITGLKASIQYEAQVQAIFAEENLSAWTDPVVFTTACCPVEEQGEVIFALNSFGRLWYDFAVQIIDADTDVEVAYLRAPDSDMYGGTIKLCCGHNYKVNWIYDDTHPDYNQYYSLALFFEPGDQFFSMAMGSAPEETSELTTFVMDCTPYCAQKPKNFTVADYNYNSATITFTSETKKGELVYSTNPDLDPETVTPTSVTFDALPASDEEYEPNPANSSLTLTGLEPLTEYYVRLRSVCDDSGISRWSDPVKVTTGSLYDAPGQVIAEPVNSSTEKLSWKRMGGEKKNNLYYRVKAAGNPIDASALETFGNVKATGEQGFEFDGSVTWSSYGYGQNPFSNVLYYPGVPAGSNISFLASNWNSKGGLVKFLWGLRKSNGKTPEEMMKEFDMECLNDADRLARIKELQEKIASSTDEEEIAKLNADIETLNAMPTDAQKLARMKELEDLIKKSTDQAEIAKYTSELNNLRAMVTAAEHGSNNGFSVSRDGSGASSRGFRAPDLGDGTYVFFIRHANDNGYLAAKDLTITPPEDLGEWILIPNISGTEYTLTGLTPNTTYEVMVEPIYDNGTTGSQSPVTIFTTLGEDTDPMKGEFSVSKGKKVQFAKGNLQYSGYSHGMEAEWSMAKQQYETFGEANIEEQGSSTVPASPKDLLCWSTVNNYYGGYNYYDSSEENAAQYFKGNFVDWGTDATLISNLGAGWSTLSTDEWNYLLTERENAATKKAVATIAIDDENTVKGLLLLPDDWTAPAGVPAIDGNPVALTLEQWTALETAGAVFLPAAGQLTSTYDSDSWKTTTTLTPAGTYWTATPSADASGLKAMILSFDDENVTVANDLNRRVMTAVRLVKCTEFSVTTAESGFTTLVSNSALDFSSVEGLTAYIATSVDNTEGKVLLKNIGVVPANTPVVLKGEPNTTYPVSVVLTTAVPPTENLLKGSATKSTELAAGEAYILSGGVFHINNAGIMPAGKAYLPATAVSTAPQLTIVFEDGQTTAIKDVIVVREELRNGVWYDLSGRRLNGMPSQKGLYIINGKKYLIK